MTNSWLGYNAYVIVLAIDTCDSRGGVVVLRGDRVLYCATHDSGSEYSSWLLPSVERVLKKAGCAMTEVHAYGVAAGPGSFTGVRVGLTTVKAWAEVYGKPIGAVSRLHAIACQAWGGTEYVAAWADAGRKQVFGGVYRRKGEVLERIGEEMVIAPGKFVRTAADLAGGERIAWAFTDPNCVLDTEEWKEREKLNEGTELVSGPLYAAIARIARDEILAGKATDALRLDANYVRRSDAEIFWKGAAHGH